jgi:serine protease Do
LKRAWMLVFWGLAALLPVQTSAHTPDDDVRPAAGIFRLQIMDGKSRDGSGTAGSGTAVLVARDTFVTNCHVVSRANKIVIEVGQMSHPVRVLRANTERDVCLLVGPAVDAPIATLGETAKLLPGAAITAVGYSGGGGLAWSAGQVEGVYSYDGKGRVVQGSAPFEEGASGGGLFDSGGRLIGLLTFKARAGGPFHYSVPVEWIADILADAPVATRRDGAPFWKRTDARSPAFLQVASLAARGNCAALAQVAGEWLRKEPDNPEAGMAARNLHHCELLTPKKMN